MGYPAPGDVRLGVVYGATDELVGEFECLTPPDPVAPTPGAFPFASIAFAVRDRLSVMLGISTAYVRPVANAHYRVTEAEPQFCYVQFFTPSQPRDPGLSYTNAGAGRLARPVARRVRVYVYTRRGEDSYGGDEIALFGTNPSAAYSDEPTEEFPTPGHFWMEERVMNALDDYMPLGAGDEPLCLTPLHVLDASEEPERPPEDEAGLVRSCLDFEVCYLMAIDPTEPPE